MLVARLDSAGDVLLAGPAVRAVAATASKVSVLTSPAGAPAAELLPGVDEVIRYAAPWVVLEPDPVQPAAIEDLVRRLALGRFDGALILTSYHQSPLPLALLLRMAGVGWVGAASEDYPGSLLDLRLAPDGDSTGDLPEAERNLRLTTAAGFAPVSCGSGGGQSGGGQSGGGQSGGGQSGGGQSGGGQSGGGSQLAIRRPLPTATSELTGAGRYLVFHPGAAVSARRPSAERSRTLVAGLVAAGHRVIVTGAPAETTLTGYVAGNGAVDLGGRLNLAELAAVLDGADVVVAPNTGPAHLAAAVGTPVVSLFAPVVPATRWAPSGVPSVVLGDQQAGCRGTRARNCPVPGHPCLDTISVTTVVRAVAELIAIDRPTGNTEESGSRPREEEGVR